MLRTATVAVLLVLSAVTFGWSQSSGGSSNATTGPAIVSPQELRARLDRADTVVIHVGDEAGYAAGHIPGARRVWLDVISIPDPALRLQMADPRELEAVFEALGVSDASQVVLYFGKDQATPAARVFVALDFLGLGDRVSYLDGGLPAWQAEGLPVTTDPPAVMRGDLTPRVDRAALPDAAWVAAHRSDPRITVVDARLPQFYTGADDGGGRYARPGHIAGAKSVPFTALLTDSGRFRPRAELESVFRAAGVAPGDTVVSYCHIGQQASLVYFAARVLGHPARLYDGSFEEWSAAPGLPVERGGPAAER